MLTRARLKQSFLCDPQWHRSGEQCTCTPAVLQGQKPHCSHVDLHEQDVIGTYIVAWPCKEL